MKQGNDTCRNVTTDFVLVHFPCRCSQNFLTVLHVETGVCDACRGVMVHTVRFRCFFVTAAITDYIQVCFCDACTVLRQSNVSCDSVCCLVKA